MNAAGRNDAGWDDTSRCDDAGAEARARGSGGSGWVHVGDGAVAAVVEDWGSRWDGRVGGCG